MPNLTEQQLIDANSDAATFALIVNGDETQSAIPLRLGGTARSLRNAAASIAGGGSDHITTKSIVGADTYVHAGGDDYATGGGGVERTQVSLSRNVSGPGRNNGNPYNVVGGWTVEKIIDGILQVTTRGIAQATSFVLNALGKGDKAGVYVYVNAIGGADEPSGEGVTGITAETTQWSEYFHGSIAATSGLGDSHPTLSFNSGMNALGDGCYLLNMSKGTIAGKINGDHLQFDTTQFNKVAVSGVTLPLTTAWGKSLDLMLQSTAGGDDTYATTSIAVTLNAIGGSTPQFTAGHAFLAGPCFYEQVEITSFTSAASGIQHVTVRHRKPHGPVPTREVTLFQGGLAGLYISLDSNAVLSNGKTRTCYPALGSLDGSSLIYACYVGGECGNRTIANGNTEAGTSDGGAFAGFHLYPGAEITTVGTYGGLDGTLEYNKIPFVVGDSIECPHPPIWTGNTAFFVAQQNSPSDPYKGSNVVSARAGGTGVTTGFRMLHIHNQNPYSMYRGLTPPGAAQVEPPEAIHIEGAYGCGIQFYEAPRDGAINITGTGYLSKIPFLCYGGGYLFTFDLATGQCVLGGNGLRTYSAQITSFNNAGIVQTNNTGVLSVAAGYTGNVTAGTATLHIVNGLIQSVS